MPDNTQQGFNVDAARKAGYSDDEILGHLTSTRAFDVQGAIKAGYSKAEIIGHLAGAPAFGPQDLAAAKQAQGVYNQVAGAFHDAAVVSDSRPYAERAASGILASQGIGQTPSPGQNSFTPLDTRDSKFGPLYRTPSTAEQEDQQVADYITGRTKTLPTPEAAWNSATRNDSNPVLMGPARIAGGVIDYKESFTDPDPVDAGRAQRYSAGSNIIGGAMQAASPMLPGAAAAAPMQTLSTLGLAYGTGYAAKKATAMAGGTPEAQEFADNAAAAIPYSQAFGLRGGKIVRGGTSPTKVGGAAPLEPVPGQPSAKASAPGEVLSPETGADGITQAPKVVGYQGEALGGSVRGGVMRTPEGTTVAGKVGPYTVSKTFKAPNAEPTVTPIGELQHPEVSSIDENIGEFSPKTIANFKKQQSRAMYEGDTAAADALAGLLDADAKAKSKPTSSPVPASNPDVPLERRQYQRSETSSIMLNQLHSQLRVATDPQEILDLKNAIARETDLGNRDAAAKEAGQSEQSTQSTQQLTVKTNAFGDGTHMVSLVDSSGEHRGDLLLEELPNKAGIKINQSEIDTDLIGKGYGTKLYKAAIDHAGSLGYQKLYSDISPSDQASKVWERLGGKKVTSKLGVYYSIPTQSTQAEPRTKTQAPRDIEGEVPTQGASEPINEQAPAYTAEQITHRNDFLKYQGQYTQIQKALDGAQAAAKGGFTRGAMNDAQVNWHQAELGRLETKMGDSLRKYARVSPPEHVDQLRAGLQRNLASTKGTADRLGKLLQTDKAAKALRGILPELPAAQRKAGRTLLGDLPDTTKMALKQAKFYSPKLKPRVDEAHRQIGDTLSGLVQQYGGDNPVATKYAVELKAGLKGEALTDAHLKSIMQIIPPQAKAEVGKLLTILKNETPVVLYHPAIRGTASSQLPEINLRNLQQILGRKLHDKASRQITPEERFANRDLATADPMAAKAGREEMSRTLVKGLQDQANKRAAFLQKQLNSIDKASGAGKRANEKTLEDLVNKQKVLSQISTADLEALVADTKTLHKQFPEMNKMQLAKQHLQGELTKRADADRQQKEILKFKVGQVISPQPTQKAVTPVSNQLGQARYFSDEWYQTPELAAAASVMDSKIAKMSPSVINKYLGPLAKKVAKGDKQSVALLNAYNKRLVELGKPEALPETLLEKQVKNITNPVEAPIGPQVGQLESFQLATGSVITGRVESIEGDKVKIVRPNGSKNVQPLANWVAPKGEEAAPPVIESKPIEAQKTEAIQATVPPAKPTGASMVGGGASASKQSALSSLSELPDAGLSELAPKLIQFAKDRPDLDADGRNNLISQMVEAALTVPKEKAMSAAYAIARKGAPPLSTWTAERNRPVPVQAGYRFSPKAPGSGLGTHDILSPTNEIIGQATIHLHDNDTVARVNNISGTDVYDYKALQNKLGTAAVKQLVRSLRSLHPTVEKIEGNRTTGVATNPNSKVRPGATRFTSVNIPTVKSMQDIGQIVKPEAAQPPQKPSQQPADLAEVRQQAIAAMQAIEKVAGDLGINRLRAIAKGLDISQPSKVYAFNKALQLYADGLKVGDPNALARARDFLLAQNGEPNTGRMSLFGLDRVVSFLMNSQKAQIPVPSQRLENIRKAQAAEETGPSLLDKLRTLPYSVLTKMYDQFQYLDQNPTRFEKWFAPDLIRDFEKRTGIDNIRIDTNPWKQARLAYGGGGGVVHAAAIEIARVKSESAEKGLKDSLGAYLNLVGYDRALRNIQGKAATALREYRRLKANADKLHTEIKLGIEPEMRLPEVINLRKQAREQRQTGKDFLAKLKNNEIVPEGYSRATVAQDLRLLQQDLGPADYSKVENWATRIYGQLKMSWDDLHQSGIISQAVHEKGELLGRGYIPLARILEVTQDVNKRFGSSSMNVRTRKSLQELEGSKLYNVDPFDAALNQIQVASREVQKNNVAGAVLNLAHMDPTGYGKAIGVPGAGYKLGATEGTMVHWAGGEKTEYVVPRFLASVLENATPSGSAVVGSTLLRTTAAGFRLGATLANLRFSIPNAVRDLQDYASLSKTGMIIKGALHPFEFGKIVHDWTTTLKSTLQEDAEYLQMMRARAGFSTIQRNISASPDMLRVNALRGGGMNPFSKVIHTIEQFNDVVENNTKLTAFKRNRELITAGRQGPMTKANVDAIAWETRNYGGSPDFASKGTMSSAINLLWMFFNAKVQGTGRTIRRMLEPRRAAMLLGTYTMMGLALMSHNLQFAAPENDGSFEYQHIPDTDKQNYYIIITPGTYHTSTGGLRHNYFKLSKGHLGQLISNPIEDAIESYTLGHVNLGQTALNFAGNMLPGQFNFREGHVVQGSVSGALSSWNPLIKEPIDQARNEDSFKSIPIEPKGMENLENPERYDPNTSLTTRRIARVIYDNSGKDQGLAKAPILGPMVTSPMRLQHAISGFGAGVADDALRIADWAQGQDKNPAVPLEGNEKLAHTPVVGGLVSRFVGSPLDQIEKDLETEFYSAAETATVQQGTFDHMAKTAPQAAKEYFKSHKKSLEYSSAIISIQKSLGELRNAQKQVLADPKMEAGQKQARIQKLHEARIKLLKMFHEKLSPKLQVTNQ